MVLSSKGGFERFMASICAHPSSAPKRAIPAFLRPLALSAAAVCTRGSSALTGNATFRFSMAHISRIRPQMAQVVINIPNAMPEIVMR